MKILLVTGIMGPPFVEGTQKSVMNLANELVGRGHDVAWLSNVFPEHPDGLSDEVSKIEIRINPSNYLELRKATEDFDVVNVHTSSPRMSFFWRLIAPMKSITTWAARRKWSRKEKLMRYFSYNVPVTDAVADEVPLSRSVTPYAVDTDDYRDREVSNGSKPVMMYIGNPSPDRGFDHVCEVLSRMETDFVFKFAVAESRGDREKAVEKLEDHGLMDKTEIHYGYIEDMPEYLSQADIFFNLPMDTYSITSPPVLTMEAMACERVTFSSNAPDFRDLIEHGEDGFVFDYDDYDEMAEKADEILGEEELMSSMGEAAREKILQTHSVEVSADAFEEVYSRRAGGNPD